MVPEDQCAKDDLGTSEPFALGGLGGTLESANAIFKLPPFGFKPVDFLLMDREKFP